MPRRRLSTLLLAAAAALGAVGCDAPGGESVRNPAASDSTVRGAPPEGPDPAAAPDTSGAAAHPDSLAGVTVIQSWTVGVVDEPGAAEGIATITSLETESLPDLDRMVLTLSEERLPGFHVEYVDQPLHECGSGHEIHPPGEAWLLLRLTGARGHTEAGEATLSPRTETPGLSVVQRIDRTCDFEAIVEFVLSVSEPRPFRLWVDEGPTRLILDLRKTGVPRP